MSASENAIGMLDVAAAPEVPSTPATETPEITAGAETEVETKEEVETDPELNEDGTPKTEEQKTADKADAKLPQDVRQALKSLRDADPKNAGVVKALHNAYERWRAVTSDLGIKGGFAEIKGMRDTLQSAGGREGIQQLQSTVDSIHETDQLLYSASESPENAKALVSNVVEDLKSEGKLDSLHAITPHLLSAIESHSPEQYAKVALPIVGKALTESGAVDALNECWRALKSGDTETAQKVLRGLGSWYKHVLENGDKAKNEPIDRERAELAKEKEGWARERAQAAKTEIGKAAQSSTNEILGGSLKHFLKMPYFKGFSRAGLVPIAAEIQNRVWGAMKADANLQRNYKSLWSAKSPDKGKIVELTQAFVKGVSDRITRQVVQDLHPNHAKGGSAAGRIAAANAKKEASAKADAAAVASGKPIYVPQKPKWEAIDWDKDPKQLLYISGKAYLKGTGKLVTWRR